MRTVYWEGADFILHRIWGCPSMSCQNICEMNVSQIAVGVSISYLDAATKGAEFTCDWLLPHGMVDHEEDTSAPIQVSDMGGAIAVLSAIAFLLLCVAGCSSLVYLLHRRAGGAPEAAPIVVVQLPRLLASSKLAPAKVGKAGPSQEGGEEGGDLRNAAATV